MTWTNPASRSARSAVLALIGGLALALGLSLAAAPAGAAPAAAPGNTVLPSVGGIARYGATLTANPGTWTPAPESFGYQWLRNGAPISGATAQKYVATAADIGKRLSVSVVATAGGESSAAVPSAQTALVQPGALVNRVRPVVTGVLRWGRTLTGSAGTWSPAPAAFRFQWLRNGRPIRGATARKYTLTVADFGSRITLRVTARRAYHRDTAAVSTPTRRIGHRVKVRRTFTYSIRTRGRITTSVAQFARLAAKTYADPRGWRSAGFAFKRVARGGKFTLVLAEARQMPRFSSGCSAQWSCRVGRFVIINQERWKHASPAWNSAGQPLRNYRHMVVNHETGHWLGHGHRGCPGRGRLAPVMMQQSKGLAGCRFNPFPLPGERWARR